MYQGGSRELKCCHVLGNVIELCPITESEVLLNQKRSQRPWYFSCIQMRKVRPGKIWWLGQGLAGFHRELLLPSHILSTVIGETETEVAVQHLF